jgi:hypothetical protein
MKIIGLPDIHGDIKKIKKLEPLISQSDLVLLIGDITNFGRKSQMKQTIELVKGYNDRCLCVPGNCDYPETEEIMDETATNLNGKQRVIDGMLFIGLGASLPTPYNGTPYEVGESYFEEHLATAVQDLDRSLPLIFVSHQPPFGTIADSVKSGIHVGSKTVRRFIEQHEPLICFTGHIHEGQGIDTIGNTRIINPGPVYSGNYAYAEISDRVDLLEIRSIS